MLPRWAVPVSIVALLAAFALVVALTTAWQQGQVAEASAAQLRAEAALASAEARASTTAAEGVALDERLAAAVARADAAGREAAQLNGRLRQVNATLTDAQSRLDVSRTRVAELASTRATLEKRLDNALEARRAAIASATALIGPPLADGHFTTRFEAFGGTQNPPMAVMDLSGSSDWRVVQVSPSAEVKVLGANGLKSVSLQAFGEKFSPTKPHAMDMYRTDFRVKVLNDRVTAITEQR
jgi:hypothetical protein